MIGDMFEVLVMVVLMAGLILTVCSVCLIAILAFLAKVDEELPWNKR